MTKRLIPVLFLAVWCFTPLVSFAQSPTEVARKIDELLISETIVSQTNICDDETFLRRAFFDIVGDGINRMLTIQRQSSGRYSPGRAPKKDVTRGLNAN